MSDTYVWRLKYFHCIFCVIPVYVYLVLITCIIHNSLRLLCSYLHPPPHCCNDPFSPEGSLKFHLSPLTHFSLRSFLPGAARSKPNKPVVILDFSSHSYFKSPVFSVSVTWGRIGAKDYRLRTILCCKNSACVDFVDERCVYGRLGSIKSC